MVVIVWLALQPFSPSHHFGSKSVTTSKEIVKCCMTIYVHAFILLFCTRCNPLFVPCMLMAPATFRLAECGRGSTSLQYPVTYQVEKVSV